MVHTSCYGKIWERLEMVKYGKMLPFYHMVHTSIFGKVWEIVKYLEILKWGLT